MALRRYSLASARRRRSALAAGYYVYVRGWSSWLPDAWLLGAFWVGTSVPALRDRAREARCLGPAGLRRPWLSDDEKESFDSRRARLAADRRPWARVARGQRVIMGRRSSSMVLRGWTDERAKTDRFAWLQKSLVGREAVGIDDSSTTSFGASWMASFPLTRLPLTRNAGMAGTGRPTDGC